MEDKLIFIGKRHIGKSSLTNTIVNSNITYSRSTFNTDNFNKINKIFKNGRHYCCTYLPQTQTSTFLPYRYNTNLYFIIKPCNILRCINRIYKLYYTNELLYIDFVKKYGHRVSDMSKSNVMIYLNALMYIPVCYYLGYDVIWKRLLYKLKLNLKFYVNVIN